MKTYLGMTLKDLSDLINKLLLGGMVFFMTQLYIIGKDAITQQAEMQKTIVLLIERSDQHGRDIEDIQEKLDAYMREFYEKNGGRISQK